jgi:hypothetical protein
VLDKSNLKIKKKKQPNKPYFEPFANSCSVNSPPWPVSVSWHVTECSHPTQPTTDSNPGLLGSEAPSPPIPPAPYQTKQLIINPVLSLFVHHPSPQILMGLYNHGLDYKTGHRDTPGSPAESLPLTLSPPGALLFQDVQFSSCS